MLSQLSGRFWIHISTKKQSIVSITLISVEGPATTRRLKDLFWTEIWVLRNGIIFFFFKNSQLNARLAWFEYELL